MKSCEKCGQANADDAQYCAQCGTGFSAEVPASSFVSDETRLWWDFIGPHKAILFSWTRGWSWDRPADRYLERFNKFRSGGVTRFALTWHWPAFLLDPFLWFLYRTMYLYALVYAVGPVVSAFLTGDFTIGIVWRIMAGASANYIYYWHIKEHVAEIEKKQVSAPAIIEEQIRDRGGVQPYVIWLGVALHLFLLGVIIEMIREGTSPTGPFQPGKPKPAVYRVMR